MKISYRVVCEACGQKYDQTSTELSPAQLRNAELYAPRPTQCGGCGSDRVLTRKLHQSELEALEGAKGKVLNADGKIRV